MKRKLLTINGPEFSNEEHGSAGLCSSKISKKSSNGLHLSITSDQRPLHGVAKTWSRCRPRALLCSNAVVSMSKWISGCYASCSGKNLSCSTTHSTGCTYKSRGILVGGAQTVAAIANDESLQVRVRKAHPPEGRSSLHPSAHKGARTGCALTLRNAASLQKHCPVARKARVKQVRPWTYPSMVYVPLCTKLVMSDINRGN